MRVPAEVSQIIVMTAPVIGKMIAKIDESKLYDVRKDVNELSAKYKIMKITNPTNPNIIDMIKSSSLPICFK